MQHPACLFFFADFPGYDGEATLSRDGTLGAKNSGNILLGIWHANP
jgi:hypothetical protein